MLVFDYWVWRVCLYYFATTLTSSSLYDPGGRFGNKPLAKLSEVLLSVQVNFRFFHLFSRVQI